MQFRFVVQSASGHTHWGELTAYDNEEAIVVLNNWMKVNYWEPIIVKVYPITNEKFVIERV